MVLRKAAWSDLSATKKCRHKSLSQARTLADVNVQEKNASGKILVRGLDVICITGSSHLP